MPTHNQNIPNLPLPQPPQMYKQMYKFSYISTIDIGRIQPGFLLCLSESSAVLNRLIINLSSAYNVPIMPIVF